MSETRDLARLRSLVAASQGWPAAKALKAFTASDDDKAVIASKALDLLRIFPGAPAAAGMMSAAFAVHLERSLTAPILVVAGTLAINGEPAFGAAEHVWVMIGADVADISLFRAAYAPTAPALLARHVAEVFGPGKGLYYDAWRRTRRLGLDYRPQRVLTEAEVTALMAQAHTAIQNAAEHPA